jgi:hypothetical protein
MGIKPVSNVNQPAAATEAAAEGAAQMSSLAWMARWAFVVLSAVFAACVVVQIYLAGMAIFVNPLNWLRHTTFIHFFELLPVLMLIASVIGRLPARLRWESAGLFGLIYVQYFTANFRAVSPAVAAVHPVVAMGIAWLAFAVLIGVWKIVMDRRPE